ALGPLLSSCSAARGQLLPGSSLLSADPPWASATFPPPPATLPRSARSALFPYTTLFRSLLKLLLLELERQLSQQKALHCSPVNLQLMQANLLLITLMVVMISFSYYIPLVSLSIYYHVL